MIRLPKLVASHRLLRVGRTTKKYLSTSGSIQRNYPYEQKESETSSIPSRESILHKLKTEKEFDILVIGGGATGAGAALDAAQRGLKVACVEREDFASGTSSRSTKLLWGGSRYLVQAFVSLFNFDLRLLRSPVSTVQNFIAEFKMVMNCHRERTFMMNKQPHLTHWVPIAVPLTKWVIWPPPFGYPPAALGPLGLFTIFFKFYDALSGFNCPPSHIMTKSRAQRKFPQLANNQVKYCSVFYEGMHDDARTNLAIAQTAAKEGAAIANYCEVVRFLKDDVTQPNRVTGAILRDVRTNETFPVHAKSILLCGGPFTDDLRRLEDAQAKTAVTGASGIHIVLPSYFAPSGIGLVDMNTSDGRFLFFLPWNDHVLVGTTDHKCQPTMRPVPDETEIKWLLNEASKYLAPELQLRRQDVLSAWAGIRPLAVDPHSSSSSLQDTASVSRDHVISHNPSTGVVFVSGGKWTTYREMAEDAVDTILRVHEPVRAQASRPCRTLQTHLVGYEGFTSNLEIVLIQEFNIRSPVAHRLVRAYGGRARDVLRIARDIRVDNDLEDLNDNLLVSGFPYLEAEVIFAVRHDWAVKAEDILARRTRLAFLNRDVAMKALPKVVSLMARELHWDTARQQQEIQECIEEYLRHFGGSYPQQSQQVVSIRSATLTDLKAAYRRIDEHLGPIRREEVVLIAEMLNHPLSETEIADVFAFAAQEQQAKTSTPVSSITFTEFVHWWNSERCNPGLTAMKEDKMATVKQVEGSGTMFG